ncbi:MAG: hypothetical protein GF317_16850 [Candidatus Lokiarchaeota archaeon]|nr:hypothetical protein [Candidatus Lokiarchaeota archaeon]MBD3201187.1 hypothetical protein [Candidatus Lokiarchaeota archaeon]
MLRQIHILHKGKRVFTHTLALAFEEEGFQNIMDSIETFIQMPMPGKIHHRPISNFQVFHTSGGAYYFIFISDLVDSIDYVESILTKTKKKFMEVFSNLEEIKETDEKRSEFINFLESMQAEIHSKIAIMGPLNAGKTTLYEMLTEKTEERSIMNFAKASILNIFDLKFDVWNFQLKDNFSLLWSKFISGSDLILFLFSLEKYNLKVLDNFLTLKKRESPLSKLILLANKVDLVDENTIKKFKNEFDGPEVEFISLKEADAKSKVLELIAKELKLKKKLPSNFEDLISEAEKFELERNLVKALAKYKELVKISNEFQYFSYVEQFKQNVNALELKIKEQTEIRKRIERKKKFAPPKQIKFSTKVSVKNLPKSEKVEKKPTKKNQPNKPKKERINNLRLKPEDVKINIHIPGNSKNKMKNSKKVQKVKESKKPKERIEQKIDNLNEVSDPAELLSQMILERGSELNLSLCKQYLEEIQESLGRELRLQDLIIAADHFVEKETFG